MGVSLMLRCGSGSAAQTCTGASGAPMTPRRSRRSDRRKEAPDPLGPVEAKAMDGECVR